jgi:hypothetical protein
MLEFQVIKLDSKFLSIEETFLRFIIFTFPYCLGDLLSINNGNGICAFEFLRQISIPGSLFIYYFMIFTNPMQQGYYDQLFHCIVSCEDGINMDLTFTNK